ncbi:MAG: hypothetical protein NTAFB05_12640 [Nitrobacter sp.]
MLTSFRSPKAAVVASIAAREATALRTVARGSWFARSIAGAVTGVTVVASAAPGGKAKPDRIVC